MKIVGRRFWYICCANPIFLYLTLQLKKHALLASVSGPSITSSSSLKRVRTRVAYPQVRTGIRDIQQHNLYLCTVAFVADSDSNFLMLIYVDQFSDPNLQFDTVLWIRNYFLRIRLFRKFRIRIRFRIRFRIRPNLSVRRQKQIFKLKLQHYFRFLRGDF